MDELMGILTIFVGILLRIGIPAGITVLLIVLFRRLDARWQLEAEKERKALPIAVQARNAGCWKRKGCSKEAMEKCPAYAHREVPCWQYYRQNDGLLQESCIGCDVFKQAPVPVSA